jgi:DNA-binding response OmpR family regulator
MSTTPETFSTGAPGPWQLLLVSDSLVEQRLLIGLLTKHRHRVIVAANGREALLEWSENEFDAVILDSQLSELDGPELVREIRGREVGTRRIPIVVLSDDEQDRERCLQAGADNFLTRPLPIAEFHEVVEAALRPRAEHPSPAVDSDVIDWRVALEATGGRRDLLVELVDIFRKEYPVTLAAIRTAIDCQDAKGLQMSAHQLKGCLRYFGRTTASELARSLEDLGRSGTIDGAATRLEPLIAAVQKLIPQLDHGPDALG